MKSYVGGLLFALGAITGGAVGYYVCYEREHSRVDQEIVQYHIYKEREERAAEKAKKEAEAKKADDAKETYISDSEKVAEANREKPSLTEFKPRTSPKEDVKYSHFYESQQKKDPEAPYIIESVDGGNDDYNTIALLYFTDGFVADEDGNLIDHLYEICGEEFKSVFAKNPDLDSVWVRNDRLHSDYEMCRQVMTYEEYMKDKPKPVVIK